MSEIVYVLYEPDYDSTNVLGFFNDLINAANACIAACDETYGMPNVTLKELDELAETRFGKGSRDIMGVSGCNLFIAEIPVQ